MSLFKFSSLFLVLSGSVILWGSSFLLSNYFSSQYIRQQAKEISKPTELSPSTKKLQADVTANPNDVIANFELGKALLQDASKNQDSSLIMSAVQSLIKVIELDSNHDQALLILAEICFENNIINKSIEYYGEYLKLKPDNLRAKQNYALSLLQNQNLDQSIQELNEIIKADPKFFRSRLSLALAYRLAGKIEEAKNAATEAIPFAPDTEGKELAHRFLVNLENPTTLDSIPAEQKSPAMLVSSFFQNHPIIGPKLKGITWPSLSLAKIELLEFPVDQMPEFAKNKFLESIEKNLSGIPEKIKLEIVDSSTGKLLLEKEVGGSK